MIQAFVASPLGIQGTTNNVGKEDLLAIPSLCSKVEFGARHISRLTPGLGSHIPSWDQFLSWVFVCVCRVRSSSYSGEFIHRLKWDMHAGPVLHRVYMGWAPRRWAVAVRSSSLACFTAYNSLGAESNTNLFPGDFYQLRKFPKIVISFRYFYSHQQFFG